MLKRTLVALAAALGALVVTASPAGAAETIGACIVEELEASGGVEHFEEVEAAAAAGDDEAQEELEAIEEDLEDCLEAPNPILPEVNEIIWGSLAFVVLLGLMLRFGFPLVKGAMDARSDRIAADMDAAEQARLEAEQVKASYEAELAGARTESARLLEEARQQADSVRADLQARAESDIAEMRANASAEIEAARTRAMADLQSEVSEIVVGAAERVVGANLDRQAQAQLIENYINQVGSR